MTRNWLKNPSFEGGWWHKDGIQELQAPNEWGDFWFAPDGTPNPIDPDWPFGRPECRVVPETQIPIKERPGFFWDGVRCLKWFRFFGSWQAGLAQTVQLESGIYRFDIGTNADVYTDFDPKVPATDPQTAMMRYLWLVDEGDELHSRWISLHPYLQKKKISWHFATAGGLGNVGFEVRMAHPVRNTGIFLDAASLIKTSGWGEECECEKPRTDYKRHVVVLPDYVTLEQAKQVLEETFNDRISIEYSYDDGMFGPDLSDKTAELKGRRVYDRKDEFDGFRDDHYPTTKLKYSPLPGEDPYPNGNGGSVERPDVAGWLGVHQLQHHPDGWGQFQLNGPPIVKTVSDIGRLIWAYNNTPVQWRHLLKMAFRKYDKDEGGPLFRYHPDKDVAAEEWIFRRVCQDLTPELKAAGVPTNQVIVLGLNEVWEHNLENNQHSIDFDIAAIKQLQKYNNQHGTEYSYGASSMATGNPWKPSEVGGEEQWQRILPLARMLRDYAGDLSCWNYHAYGLMIPGDPGKLAEYAQWLQLRWVEMWDWLNAHGAARPFMMGEGGHVEGDVSSSSLSIQTLQLDQSSYAIKIPETGEVIVLKKRKPLYNPTRTLRIDGKLRTMGLWLNPGQGWVNKITWDRAAAELIQYWDDEWERINKERDYEATYGCCPFQAGNDSDWKLFNLAGMPLRSLAARQYERWRAFA